MLSSWMKLQETPVTAYLLAKTSHNIKGVAFATLRFSTVESPTVFILNFVLKKLSTY